jgi:D-glycero-D-manno-heptose 1,7-bisphosphate phosphatase
MTAPRAAIILDRDGTLVDVVRDEETGAISVAFHPDQLRLLPGVISGLQRLRDADYVLAIATNQPAPAKGQFSAAAVDRTNAALVEMLDREGVRIEAVRTCMHHPGGGPGGDAALVGPCECRKPKPGLIHDLVDALALDRSASWMIGDSVGDLQAGRAAGLRTGLVFASNRCELCPLRAGAASLSRSPDVHGPTLSDIAEAILGQGRSVAAVTI